MILLKGAFSLTLKRVFNTIINILLFRITYSFIKAYVFTGFSGFIATIYINGKIKSFFEGLLRKKFVDKPEFDVSKVKFGPNNEHESLFKQLFANSEANLFANIFSSASNSSLLSLITIISIEYLNEHINLVFSILICVFIAFVITFVSSIKYTYLVINNDSEKDETLTNDTFVYYSINDELNEAICLFQNKSNIFKIKMLNPTYSSYISNIVELYFNSNKLFDNEKLVFQLEDYYDVNYELSKLCRKNSWFAKESWTEFNLFILIGFKVSEYSKRLDNKLKKS